MVFECATTTTVPAGAVGSLGGGCDHARRWQAAQWPALAAGKWPGRPEPPGAPWGRAGAEAGARQGQAGPGRGRGPSGALALTPALAPHEGAQGPWRPMRPASARRGGRGLVWQCCRAVSGLRGPPARRSVAAVEERRCDALLEALHHAPAEGGRREWGEGIGGGRHADTVPGGVRLRAGRGRLAYRPRSVGNRQETP